MKYEYRSVDVDNIETDIGEREARRTAMLVSSISSTPTTNILNIFVNAHHFHCLALALLY